MGPACRAYRGEERRIRGFGLGNLWERDHLGYPGVWENSIKMDFQEVG